MQETINRLIRIIQSDIEQLSDACVLQKSKNEIIEWMLDDLNGVARELREIAMFNPTPDK